MCEREIRTYSHGTWINLQLSWCGIPCCVDCVAFFLVVAPRVHKSYSPWSAIPLSPSLSLSPSAPLFPPTPLRLLFQEWRGVCGPSPCREAPQARVPRHPHLRVPSTVLPDQHTSSSPLRTSNHCNNPCQDNTLSYVLPRPLVSLCTTSPFMAFF